MSKGSASGPPPEEGDAADDLEGYLGEPLREFVPQAIECIILLREDPPGIEVAHRPPRGPTGFDTAPEKRRPEEDSGGLEQRLEVIEHDGLGPHRARQAVQEAARPD